MKTFLNSLTFSQLYGVLLFCLVTMAASESIAADQAEAGFSDPQWHYPLKQPTDNWMSPSFKSEGWTVSPGGFGTVSTPGSRVGTEWRTKDIWLRREVGLETVPEKPGLLMHHDEDVKVFLNGHLILEQSGYTNEYKVFPISQSNKQHLKAGWKQFPINTFAI